MGKAKKGGELSFAAQSTNGSNAQKLDFLSGDQVACQVQKMTMNKHLSVERCAGRRR